MDATPLRLGQEIGGFARQIELSIKRATQARDAVLELPVGGTAVGSGINTHPEFGSRVAAVVAEETGLDFIEAVDHFEANAQRDGLVDSHGGLTTIANTLFNVANNIRWLGSGPRCGFFELKLPSRQPGSSIMPESKSRYVRKYDAGGCSGDRQWPDDHHEWSSRREFPAQYYDACHGARNA